MTQDINTKSRRNSKANSGGEKAVKGGEKKSLDIDFASVQSDTVGSPSEESESRNKDAYVGGASKSPAITKKTESIQYYNAQADRQSVKADQQKEPAQSSLPLTGWLFVHSILHLAGSAPWPRQSAPWQNPQVLNNSIKS